MKVSTITLLFGLAGVMFFVITSRLFSLQKQVSCLQEQVEKDWYLTQYNVRIANHNKKLNDRNIEVMNENLKHIVNYLKMGY